MTKNLGVSLLPNKLNLSHPNQINFFIKLNRQIEEHNMEKTTEEHKKCLTTLKPKIKYSQNMRSPKTNDQQFFPSLTHPQHTR